MKAEKVIVEAMTYSSMYITYKGKGLRYKETIRRSVRVLEPLNQRFEIKKLGLILSIMITTLMISGCLYSIRINGFKGTDFDIVKEKKVYVYENIQAPNLLLEKEVSKKLKVALKMKGYVPVDNIEGADYVLLSIYGIGPGITVTNVHSATHTNSGINAYTGKAELVPQVKVSTSTNTLYPRFLTMTLYNAKVFTLSQNPEPLWIGDIQSNGGSSDLRNVIDYLIVAGFEYFGEDTGEQKKKTMVSTDEQVKKLREEVLHWTSVGNSDGVGK